MVLERFKQLEFYRCPKCGAVVQMLHSYGSKVMCCGAPMERLVPNTVEAAHEKHIPVVTQVGTHINVRVGTAAHPMLKEHYIEWIAIQTRTGEYKRYFKPGDKPETTFDLNGGVPLAVYAYCNLHGLWIAKLPLEEKV
ncbi:MAG: desulfoferrodoxin family protein [Eubacteriales bacterium]|nr:desulfoferrodoxin family protein [Eubacteriales bacterium]